MNGSPILTAAEMRVAEAEAIAAGAPVETLMERAGQAAAAAISRYAGPLPTLVLCGPGNNGGDGYVIARALEARGVAVRVAALSPPTSAGCKWAAAQWSGPVEQLGVAAPAPLLVDALFGTGLTRPLDERASSALVRLAQSAGLSVAVDLPSGVATDSGAILSPVPGFDLTVTFEALKPAHLLQPAARHMGRLAVADIGIAARSGLHQIGRPHLIAPGPDDHKYSRGYVAMLAGEMPGATALAASAALRAGAGYVRIVSDEHIDGVAAAVVQGGGGSVDDPRIGAIVVGPGLGRGQTGRDLLEQAFQAHRPLVIDADALTLLAEQGADRLRALAQTPVVTPHAGEFARLFGEGDGSKIDRARDAAARSGAVVVFKGPGTVVATPDGRAAIARPAPSWLASAGTGDVLSGIIAAMRAGGHDAFEAACAGVWLHGHAAEIAGPALIADALVAALPRALAACL